MSKLVLWRVSCMFGPSEDFWSVCRPGEGGSCQFFDGEFRDWRPVLVSLPDDLTVATTRSGELCIWSGPIRRDLAIGPHDVPYFHKEGALPRVDLRVLADGWDEVDLSTSVWYEGYTPVDGPLPDDVTAVLGELYCRHGIPDFDCI